MRRGCKKMSDVCPLCGGAGKKIKVVRNVQTNRMKTIAEWCLCEKSRYISKTYDMLKPYGATYLPLEKIHKSMTLNLKDLSESPNLYIINTNIRTFFLHVKSVIIKYRFIDNPPLIYFCRAIEILKRFFVQQEDESKPQLTDLNRYDLLIFTLDTLQKNAHLGTCVSQVVYNRYCEFKPTWIYLPESTVFENTREYTDELKAFIDPIVEEGSSKKKKFDTISIVDTTMKIKHVRTVSQKISEGFSPFTR